jgi:type IV pilus assembly PilN-like protein
VKPVTLNLASRPFRNNTLVGSILTIVGVGLVAATAYNLYVFLGYGSAYAQLQKEQNDDRGRIAQLQVEERKLAEQVRGRDFRAAFERGKLASELVRKNAFSWTLLFNTLEKVVPPDVVMTAIRPNISSDTIVIRIEGVAKSPTAFLSLQDRLQRSPDFTKVYPQTERQLNPNLPDITFLLSCEYLPQVAQPPDKVAGDQGSAAPSGAPPEQATGPTQASGPAAAPAPPAGAVAANANPPNAPAPGETTGASDPAAAGAAAPVIEGPKAAARATRVAQMSVPVGRDGLPIDAAPQTTLAPGGLYAAPAAADTGRPPTNPGTKKSGAGGKPEAGKPSGSRSAVPTNPAGHDPAKPPAHGSPAGDKTSGAAATTAPAPAEGVRHRTIVGGRVWDPNNPMTMPAKQKADLAARPKPPEKPVVATRLDVPLLFKAVPAGDVYARLAEAHGVRFQFQPGFDRTTPVSLDLRGRRLEDALAMVAGQAHHRVKKIADGVYRVEGSESGQALEEGSVAEEPLGEGTP